MNEKENIATWFKWGLTTIVVIAIIIKLLLAYIDISNIQFNFTDLLSLILALFAVWISINFYHKNNETSNKFYNNTYTFTKDISETLGRIEERFGEKLESLKEENKSLSGRIDKYYSNFPKTEKDVEKDAKKEQEVQNKLEKELQEQKELLDAFTKKYKVAEQDKNKFIEQLDIKNQEVNRLQRKLKLFEISNRQTSEEIDDKYDIPSRIIKYFTRNLIENKDLREIFESQDMRRIMEEFNVSCKRFSPAFVRDLEKYDMIDESHNLTDKGLSIFLDITNRI